MELGFAHVGNNIKISKFARFYGQANLIISDNVRIDDYAIISVGNFSKIGSYVHIAPHVVISAPLSLYIGDFSTISSRCAVYGQSDDFTGEYLTNPTLPEELRNVAKQSINIGKHVIIGTGTTILPGGDLADGTAIGAMSLVKSPTSAWSVYAGIPASKLSDRSMACLRSVPEN